MSVAAILLVFGNMTARAEPVPAHTLTFGVVPQQSATRLARLWVPLLQAVGKRAGVTLRFRTAPDIPAFEARVRAGDYDIAYMNPYHYTTFHRSTGYRAFAHEAGKRLTGILVVRRESPIMALEDLDGLELALPAPAAFAASLVTRAELKRRGIQARPHFVGSHDSVYRAVAKGLFPVGGGVIRTLDSVDDPLRGQLRILWQSPGYTPHAFAAHPRVPRALVRRIQTALVSLGGQDGDHALLKALRMRGIEAAQDSEWDDVRALGLTQLEPAAP